MNAYAGREPRRLFARKLDLKNGRVDMSHGAGGRASAQLVAEIFLPEFGGAAAHGDDAARVTPPSGAKLSISTDSFVVTPLFFPGGDIGSLAVHGTVNDVACGGAKPLWLACGFVIEEGFPFAELKRVARSMGQAARDAGVTIVAGDTKVVERGHGDGVYVNTTGVGAVLPGVAVGSDRARPGDAVLVSGPIGDHGVAILSKREGLSFETEIVSDSAALNGMIAGLIEAAPEGLRTLRDPTRGGLAAALNEISWASASGMEIDEAAVPIREEVRAACEFLGIDPFDVANEGKLVVVCASEAAGRVLAALRAHPLGAQAARIGTVTDDPERFVRLKTDFGGERVVDWRAGEALPRIC